MQKLPASKRLLSRVTTDDRNNAGDIRRIPRPHLAGELASPVIEQRSHHHLVEIGTMIFGVPISADAFAPLTLKVEGDGIEKHHLQIGEEITAEVKHPFFGHILGASGANGVQPV